MCQHQNIFIIPTEESSWGIADTYHIKCTNCNQLLYKNIHSSQLKDYIKILMPANANDLLSIYSQ